MEILLIGSSSGKTILVRQLRHLTTKPTKKTKNKPISFQTSPTVGVELDTITINKTTITIREVGAPMAPMWSAFHSKCHAIIFLIDTSDHAMLPEAAVELWHTLNSQQIQNKAILIIGTKKDVPSLLSEQDIQKYIRFDEINATHTGTVTWKYLNLTLPEDCSNVLDYLKEMKQTE